MTDPHADLRERLIELRDYLRRGEQSEFLGAEDFDTLAEAVNALTPEQQDTGREDDLLSDWQGIAAHWKARAEAAEAKIEKFSRALERIANEPNRVDDEGLVHQIRFREIAREALSDDDQEADRG